MSISKQLTAGIQICIICCDLMWRGITHALNVGLRKGTVEEMQIGTYWSGSRSGKITYFFCVVVFNIVGN